MLTQLFSYDLLELKHFQTELWPFGNSYETNLHFSLPAVEEKRRRLTILKVTTLMEEDVFVISQPDLE